MLAWVTLNIDWALLCRQKQWLLAHEKEAEEAAGLVNLIDSLQDFAVDDAGIPARVVFGAEEEEPALEEPSSPPEQDEEPPLSSPRA